MSEAQRYFDLLMAIEKEMEGRSVETTEEVRNMVTYRSRLFEDGSKLIEGSNGYLGAETPQRNEVFSSTDSGVGN